MKDPKTLFPFLFATSWVGNLFLTVIAFYLAFTHDGPLSPSIFLTVAVCILSGNILPIAVYGLFIHWREAELKAESAEVATRVRDALRRSEDILGRLDEAEGSLSKAILVTRQVPERIRESFEDLLALSERLDTLEINSFTESLSGQSESIDSMHKELEATGNHLQKLEKDLAGVPKTLEKVLEESKAAAPGGSDEDMDVPMAERLDLVFETLETIQDSLDGLLAGVADLKVSKKAPKKTEAAKEKPVEIVEESKPAPEPPPVEQKSLPLESGQPDRILEIFPDNSDQVRLVAHAMVGINNKLFIRGDEPWLSWDRGVPMDLIGIGEFVWSRGDIKEPLEISIRLNDEIEAIGGTVKLIPGKTVEISPHFPG